MIMRLIHVAHLACPFQKILREPRIIQWNACAYLNMDVAFVQPELTLRQHAPYPMQEDRQDPAYRKARRAYLVSLDKNVERMRQANHCIGCTQCVDACPQRINIPVQLRRIEHPGTIAVEGQGLQVVQLVLWRAPPDKNIMHITAHLRTGLELGSQGLKPFLQGPR